MSHPKEEEGAEAEVEEAIEAEAEEEELPKKTDSKDLAEDSLPSEETGNLEANRGRGGQKFDKSPNVKKARVNTKTPNQDKERCYKCNEFGHWAKECPQNQQNNGGNGPAQQKTFPGATYNYMYPMVPQVPMAPVAMPSNGIQVPMLRKQYSSPRTDARIYDADQ